MSIQIVPIVFAVIGLGLYFLSPNAKGSELGRLIFFASILALLFSGAGHSLTIK